MKRCEYCGNATIDENWAQGRDLVVRAPDGPHYFCSNECLLRFELDRAEIERQDEPERRHDPVTLPHPHAG